MSVLFNIIKKEIQQFLRDPKMFRIILVAPLMELIILGYAVNLDINVVHTVVYDNDHSSISREYLERFESTGRFKFDYYVDNYNDLQEYIDNGKALLAIVIPTGFEKSIMQNRPAKVQLLFEGSDGNSASIAAGYAQTITLNYAKQILIEKAAIMGIKHNAFNIPQAQVRVWYNPELLTRNFMVPGIVGLLLVLVTLLLTSLAIVKEKEVGTLEQLIVTPIKSYELILGKMIPYTIIGFIVISVVLVAMALFFGIVIKGSVLFLFFASFLFSLSMLGLGLLISTISKTQQQAMMIVVFLAMMPMIYLSGFAFPIENMPKIIQYFTYLIPLRYFITIIRGVILKGTGFETYYMELIILFVMGVSILLISSLRFRKRLD